MKTIKTFNNEKFFVKIYGNEKTELDLDGLALEVYSNSDFEIAEHEDDDTGKLTYFIAFNNQEPFQEIGNKNDLIQFLEEWA